MRSLGIMTSPFVWGGVVMVNCCMTTLDLNDGDDFVFELLLLFKTHGDGHGCERTQANTCAHPTWKSVHLTGAFYNTWSMRWTHVNYAWIWAVICEQVFLNQPEVWWVGTWCFLSAYLAPRKSLIHECLFTSDMNKYSSQSTMGYHQSDEVEQDFTQCILCAKKHEFHSAFILLTERWGGRRFHSAKPSTKKGSNK